MVPEVREAAETKVREVEGTRGWFWRGVSAGMGGVWVSGEGGDEGRGREGRDETYGEHGAHEDGFDGGDGGVGVALAGGGAWLVACLFVC